MVSYSESMQSRIDKRPMVASGPITSWQIEGQVQWKPGTSFTDERDLFGSDGDHGTNFSLQDGLKALES